MSTFLHSDASAASKHHWLRRVGATCAVAAGAVVGVAVPTSAHVTVSSPDAAPGGFGKLVVRVPTESDSASTTKVAVQLPTDTPFAFVSTKPHPGWTVATTERKLDKPVTVEGFTLSKAVATVTWTASEAGDAIAPGQFDEFELSLGTFPKGVHALSFPTTQTYSDGTVVDWNQPVAEGQDDPEHPAPTLELTAASDVPSATQADAESSGDPVAGSGSSDDAAIWLAGAALVVAIGAVVLAALAALGLIGPRRSRA